jgi:hypothetical protein
MSDENKVKAAFANCVALRGKHQWKIVSFGAESPFYPRALGRGASLARAWASAVSRQRL